MSGETPACSAILLTKLTNAGTFNTWQQGYADTLNGYAALAAPPSTDQKLGLASAANDIMQMSLCIQQKINKNGASPNSIFTSQEDILDLNDQIAQEETNVAIAKDRVAYIRHPEEHVSSYESWFPIDRPIHTVSLVILISISLFFATFALLMLASVLGVDVTLYIQPSVRSTRSGFSYWLYSQITPTSVLLLSLLIVIIVYISRQ